MRSKKDVSPKQPSKQSIKALIKKLEKWGETLPAEERVLLEYMLQRAEGVTLTEAPLAEGDTKIASLTEVVYRPTVAAGRRPRPWTKMGKAWVRKV